MSEPTPYEKNIIAAFKACCDRREELTGEREASPKEVTAYMERHKTISRFDTVLDIEKLMKSLRNRGQL